MRPEITVDDAYLITATAPESLEKASRDRWLQILAGISTG
jgi:hypothetical protein